MRDLDDLFSALAQSRFRRRFKLSAQEMRYLDRHGTAGMRSHAAHFVGQRLAPAQPANDGRQTPMRNHPVFVAQHATATCCRRCLARWHGIPAGKPLGAAEQAYVLAVIERWLRAQHEPAQRDLFDT